MSVVLTPAKAANRLTRILNVFAEAHGTPRFPIDVTALALGCADTFQWTDPISQVAGADIQSFEGALIASDNCRKWMLLYNDRITSPGRIRFTQAHELGHYLLHRSLRSAFQCTERDMTDWSEDEKNIEAQADVFASTLLMPLDDFRSEGTGAAADFDFLGTCADRYGVSLTAATLRWLQHTEIPAILVVHRDGYIDWAWSSKPAMKAGAFFRTKGRPVGVPMGTLAGDSHIAHNRIGQEIPAKHWFPHASTGDTLRECKISADQYDSVMTLLVIPRSVSVWPLESL